MVREGFPDDIELRLRDKQEPDTQGSGEGSSKEREQQKTEAGISPMWTKDRKKATAEEGDGWGLVGGGRTV